MALVQVTELARIFGRTERHIQQLVRAGMPRASHGQYDLGPCMQWYIRYLQDRLAHRQGEMDEGFDGGYNVDRERARLTKAQADAAEIELGKMRGELVPVSEYRRRSSAIILQARQQMLQLPARAASQLEGEPRAIIKSKLTLLLYAALASLSNGEGPESDEHPDPDIA